MAIFRRVRWPVHSFTTSTTLYLSPLQPATIDNFRLDKKQYYARVVLSRRIDGPQDVVLKMTMNVTSFYDNFEGKAESRIYLYITPAGDVDHL